MDRPLSRRHILQLAMAPALLGKAQVPDMAPSASRIYPGPDGRLSYVPDEQGNTIHDASHAGYGGGGVGIPTVHVRETAWPVAGDNTANVQAAIDRVSALPLDTNGFRGAVLLKAGVYRMAMPIRIAASGVVLRGEGMGDTGTVLVGTGTGRAPAPPAADAAGPVGRGAGPGGRAGGAGGGVDPVPGRGADSHANPHRRRVGGDDHRRHATGHHRRIRAGRRAQLQRGVGARLQARRPRDRPPHRQSGWIDASA